MDVCIDQRAATVSRSLNREDALKILYVPKAVIDRPRPACKMRQVIRSRRRARKVAATVATAALQDADALARLDQSARRDSPAEASTDHDGIEEIAR